MDEFLVTERVYVERLDLCLRHFYRPLSRTLNPPDVAALFGSFLDLRHVAISFLSSLEIAADASEPVHKKTDSLRSASAEVTADFRELITDEPSPTHSAVSDADRYLAQHWNLTGLLDLAPSIPLTFLLYLPALRHRYSEYAAHTASQTAAIEQLSSVAETRAVLARVSAAAASAGCPPLASLLVLPIQRVCRYPLLLDAIVREVCGVGTTAPVPAHGAVWDGAGLDSLGSVARVACTVAAAIAGEVNRAMQRRRRFELLRQFAARVAIDEGVLRRRQWYTLLRRDNGIVRIGPIWKVCRAQHKQYEFALLCDALMYVNERGHCHNLFPFAEGIIVLDIDSDLTDKSTVAQRADHAASGCVSMSDSPCGHTAAAVLGLPHPPTACPPNAFAIFTPGRAFVAFCDDAAIKERWLVDIAAAFSAWAHRGGRSYGALRGLTHGGANSPQAADHSLDGDGDIGGMPPAGSRPVVLVGREGGVVPPSALSDRMVGIASGWAPLWVPDRMCPKCTICREPFGVLRRRHHCRQCGSVCCSACSGHSAVVRNQGPDPVRICNECHVLRTVAPAGAKGRDRPGVHDLARLLHQWQTGGGLPTDAPPAGPPGVPIFGVGVSAGALPVARRAEVAGSPMSPHSADDPHSPVSVDDASDDGLTSSAASPLGRRGGALQSDVGDSSPASPAGGALAAALAAIPAAGADGDTGGGFRAGVDRAAAAAMAAAMAAAAGAGGADTESGGDDDADDAVPPRREEPTSHPAAAPAPAPAAAVPPRPLFPAVRAAIGVASAANEAAAALDDETSARKLLRDETHLATAAAAAMARGSQGSLTAQRAARTLSLRKPSSLTQESCVRVLRFGTSAVRPTFAVPFSVHSHVLVPAGADANVRARVTGTVPMTAEADSIASRLAANNQWPIMPDGSVLSDRFAGLVVRPGSYGEALFPPPPAAPTAAGTFKSVNASSVSHCQRCDVHLGSSRRQRCHSCSRVICQQCSLRTPGLDANDLRVERTFCERCYAAAFTADDL